MSREGFHPESAPNKTATVKYICTNCASSLSLGRNDPIRCNNCAHRVLYKARTKRMVQFEAR